MCQFFVFFVCGGLKRCSRAEAEPRSIKKTRRDWERGEEEYREKEPGLELGLLPLTPSPFVFVFDHVQFTKVTDVFIYEIYSKLYQSLRFLLGRHRCARNKK